MSEISFIIPHHPSPRLRIHPYLRTPSLKIRYSVQWMDERWHFSLDLVHLLTGWLSLWRERGEQEKEINVRAINPDG